MIHTCVKNDRLVTIELGVGKEFVRTYEDGTIHAEDYGQLILLNRFGAFEPSTIDSCEKYWLPEGVYPTKLTLFAEPGFGVVGSQYAMSNGETKSMGDTSSSNPSTEYEFSATKRMIGLEGVTNNEHLDSAGPITVFTVAEECTAEEAPPLPEIIKVDGKKVIISNSTNITEPNVGLIVGLSVTFGLLFIIFCVIVPIVICVCIGKYMLRHKSNLGKTLQEGNES